MAHTPLVAFVGNPNAGKTSLFNALTGSRQKVGNYPGVTVEQVTGQLKHRGQTIDCLDIPGLYSLNPQSEDEQVAVRALKGETGPRPDLLLCVIDGGNLERNLYLFSQIAEEGFPAIIALTKVDRLNRHGSGIDTAALSTKLGIPVIPVDGLREKGIDTLKDAILGGLENPQIPHFVAAAPVANPRDIEKLRERLARAGIDRTYEEVEREVSFPTEEFNSFLRETPELREIFDRLRSGKPFEEAEERAHTASIRYNWAKQIKDAVFSPSPVTRKTRTDKIDRFLTHRVFGLMTFAFIMYLVFQGIYTFAKPVMNGINWMFDALAGLVGPPLEGIPWLQSLVVDGVIKGVGSVLVFLPQIMILFFFIAVLEGTGYLARAAFLMDRLLGWCGLNGRAFIPLLSSFACAIPGILSARVMPDQRSRLATILVAPLMSCSARLPVYILLIGAFIQPRLGAGWAGFTLFAMHLIGLLVAIPLVWLLNRRMLKGKRLPFLLELPPYQWPKWRDVWLAMYFRAKVFVTTAGTTIVVMSILIWLLSYFPRYQGEPPAGSNMTKQQVQLSQSYLGRFGRTLEPAFVPAGFDWRITTSILAAFPARETVVPSMGILFGLEKDSTKGESLEKALDDARWPDGRKLLTPWTAVGLMVFFALCCQCMSTLATIKRETNSVKWPLFVFSYMTVLAYVCAVLIHQISRFFT